MRRRRWASDGGEHSVLGGAQWHGSVIQWDVFLRQLYRLTVYVPQMLAVAGRLLGGVTAGWAVSASGRIGQVTLAQHDPLFLLRPEHQAVEGTEQGTRTGTSEGSDEAALLEMAQTWGGLARHAYRSVAQLPGRQAAAVGNQADQLQHVPGEDDVGRVEEGLLRVAFRCMPVGVAV